MTFDPFSIDRARELSDANNPWNPENWDDEVDLDQPLDVQVYEVPGRSTLTVLAFSNENESFEWYNTEATLEEAEELLEAAKFRTLTIRDFENQKDIGSWREIKNKRRLIASTGNFHKSIVDPITPIGRRFIAD